MFFFQEPPYWVPRQSQVLKIVRSIILQFSCLIRHFRIRLARSVNQLELTNGHRGHLVSSLKRGEPSPGLNISKKVKPRHWPTRFFERRRRALYSPLALSTLTSKLIASSSLYLRTICTATYPTLISTLSIIYPFLSFLSLSVQARSFFTVNTSQSAQAFHVKKNHYDISEQTFLKWK